MQSILYRWGLVKGKTQFDIIGDGMNKILSDFSKLLFQLQNIGSFLLIDGQENGFFLIEPCRPLGLLITFLTVANCDSFKSVPLSDLTFVACRVAKSL